MQQWHAEGRVIEIASRCLEKIEIRDKKGDGYCRAGQRALLIRCRRHEQSTQQQRYRHDQQTSGHQSANAPGLEGAQAHSTGGLSLIHI